MFPLVNNSFWLACFIFCLFNRHSQLDMFCWQLSCSSETLVHCKEEEKTETDWGHSICFMWLILYQLLLLQLALGLISNICVPVFMCVCSIFTWLQTFKNIVLSLLNLYLLENILMAQDCHIWLYWMFFWSAFFCLSQALVLIICLFLPLTVNVAILFNKHY